MRNVGIDLEQFVSDPHGSGIQRVLQYLAKKWPDGDLTPYFVVPWEDGHGLLDRGQAADLLTIPFLPRGGEHDLREPIRSRIAEFNPPKITDDELLPLFDSWLLAEVSYLPSVLRRFEDFATRRPVMMVGYDTLPMSEPANYRFRPGVAPWASEYFRLLAGADAVVCISDDARDSILGRLRRDPRKATTVSHPGGDHIPVRPPEIGDRVIFSRLGTLEARKRPVEIARAFRRALTECQLNAELLFIGGHSHSDEGINRAIQREVENGGVRWIEGASDVEVQDLVHDSSAFLSIGVEGYGIPVLESIRLGTPVLYDGVQPAAALMEGRGARRVEMSDEESMVRAFTEWSAPERLATMASELDPHAVPTWNAFCEGVASVVDDALRS